MMEEKLLDARIRVLLMAAITLCSVFIVIVLALIAGLWTSNDLIDNEKVFTLLSYIVTAVAGAITGGFATVMGFKADKQDAPDMSASVEAPVNVSVVNDLDEDEPVVDQPVTTSAVDNHIEPEMIVNAEDDDDDDDLAPWEKYRNDLRYDANGDGIVDENDFPDWRNPNQ